MTIPPNKIDNSSLPKLPRADAVVLTCNNNENYYKWIPVAIKSWKMMNIKPYVFFILSSSNEALPESIKDIPEIIKVVNPAKNRTTGGFAQVSRLLLPAIIDAQNVLISDIDYIPLPSWYYELSKGHPQKCFVAMRKKDGKDFFMGFNCTHPDTWSRVFELTDRTIDGVCNKMLEWSTNGIWTHKWGSDQTILKNVLNNLPNEELVVAYSSSNKKKKLLALDEDFKVRCISESSRKVPKRKITKEQITDDIIWFGNDVGNRKKNVIPQAYELLDFLEDLYKKRFNTPSI
tara:strand:+ start:7758 stop:8624 length:867 start_codon:yes stop_codon:yes gene_type:complete